MRRAIVLPILLLTITCGMSFNTPIVLAEYMYVHLRNLAACEVSFLGMQIMTSGIFRSDVYFIPEMAANCILVDSTSQNSICMCIYDPFNRPSNGSDVIVYGTVYWDTWAYCFSVSYWELGSITCWNLADVNQDLKVDIFDVVLCINSYGTTPQNPQWSTFCDIASPYCLIDILDITMVCQSYGEEYTP